MGQSYRKAQLESKKYFYEDENIFVAIINRGSMISLKGYDYVIDVSTTKASIEKAINKLPFYVSK